jgi:hypothetical protein
LDQRSLRSLDFAFCVGEAAVEHVPTVPEFSNLEVLDQVDDSAFNNQNDEKPES